MIELKDVGLRIKVCVPNQFLQDTLTLSFQELSALLQLPPTVLITRAQIACLHIVIPADLYASSIETEVSGVEIEIDIRAIVTRTKGAATSPRRGDRANRPRIDFPAVHDPGGQSRRRTQSGRHAAHELLDPFDLARSYVEVEPQDEREELEAVLASQSQQLDESSLSSQDDLGIGATVGVSLPSFIANFFRGIGERLQVSIRKVAVLVKVHRATPEEGVEEADNHTTFLVRIVELALKGAQAHHDQSPTRQGKAVLKIEDFGVVLVRNEKSARSSPSAGPRLPASATVFAER